jgi:steroid 5-alpha reductase family enzyme
MGYTAAFHWRGNGMTEKRISRKTTLYLVCAYAAALLAGAALYRALPEGWSLPAKSFAADIAATAVVFLFSVRAGNSSIYDPYWSVAPAVLCLFWYLNGAPDTHRLLLLLFLAAVIFQSVRLTVNWAVSWGGMNHEDWRYRSFRIRFPRSYWLVSFSAVHLFPTVMVFAGLYPAYITLTTGFDDNLGPAGRCAAIGGVLIMAAGTVLEHTADIQLHRYRSAAGHSGQVITEGLWQYSRHPNYLGEILFWFGIAVFSQPSAGGRLWFFLFPAAMLALFLGYSIPAMEKRLLATRSGYQAVQQSTAKLIPSPLKILRSFLPSSRKEQTGG